jgi:hypothetical protein
MKIEMDTDLFGNPTPPNLPPQKRKENQSAINAHFKLLQIHGKIEGEKCKTCENLIRRKAGAVYYKCRLFSTSNSASSDWRANWEACGKYKLDELHPYD